MQWYWKGDFVASLPDEAIEAHIAHAAKPLRAFAANLDITERKRSEEHKKLLMAEVNHRSRSLLAVVQAIVNQSARGADRQRSPSISQIDCRASPLVKICLSKVTGKESIFTSLFRLSFIISST
jgi:hypothetical protein